MEGRRALMRDALADDERLPCFYASERLVKRKIAAGADMLFDFLAAFLGRRFLFLIFLAEAVIRAALLAKQLCIFSEQVAPLRLNVGPTGPPTSGPSS